MRYSIVARDTSTGELGVAVQSQAFNRGRGSMGAPDPWEHVIDVRVEEGGGSVVALRRLVARAEADLPTLEE